jgi:hypothetical protein
MMNGSNFDLEQTAIKEAGHANHQATLILFVGLRIFTSKCK